MRAIVLSVVLVASPALAQIPTAPASSPPAQDAPVSTAVPVPAPEAAQVPPALDPLADLISQSNQTTDEEEVEAASKPAPKHKGQILPIPPPEPEASATPGGELTKAQVYELRVKGSVAAAQNLQGPLDGAWRIAGADGGQLYALQIVDKAGGAGELEGAWRDLRRPGSVGSTGLIEDLRRDGDTITARFSPKVGESSVLTLRSTVEERWSGELAENGANIAVVAEHLLPQAPPGYETERRGPYVWPGAQRPIASRAASAAPACSTKGKKGKALKAAKAKCAAAARKSKGSTVKKGKGGKAKATVSKKRKSTKKRR
ncbi:hypothetical protein [Caulobacter sp. RL271]|jgi:hypothetical protein|uniref:Uncharacterized protein n=1 Tax=Caulobacter segnis TaxID=88688 RepID=A0ABY4ZU20_9CAUL|nr:hypothetical protein [Caulobacter segnis]USQ96086.1 hypothetical protein MZV50_00305 [Caulobacter segnis]